MAEVLLIRREPYIINQSCFKKVKKKASYDGMELVNQATMYAFREKSKYVLKDIWRLVLTI